MSVPAATFPFRSLFALLSAGALAAGCGGGGGGDDLETPAGTAAPAVTYVTPSNNAAGVGTNTPVTVSFSQPMNRASLDAALTLVDQQTGLAVPLQGVAYDATNHIATVTPQQPLHAGGTYRATVSAAATGADGKAMDSGYAWSFGTASGADTIAPEVSSHAPRAGQGGVAVNAHIAMSFSEPMNAASLHGAFMLTRAGVPVPGKLGYIGQAAVFTLDAPLAAQTDYVATLRRSATDLAGNPLAADHTWVFTTAAAAVGTTDSTPPRVVAVTPLPNASGVPRDSRLSVIVDEPIYPFVYGKLDGAVVAVSIDYTTRTVTMSPGKPLQAGGSYQASVTVMDLAGNVMSAPYTWSFVIAP